VIEWLGDEIGDDTFARWSWMNDTQLALKCGSRQANNSFRKRALLTMSGLWKRLLL